MFAIDTGEPFGLPAGTIRGIIALAFTGTIVQQTIVGAIEPIVFIGIAGPFLGWYVNDRSKSDAAKALRAEEPVPAPYVGPADGDND